jgi:hypothetical protein
LAVGYLHAMPAPARLALLLCAVALAAGCARLGGEAFQTSHNGAIPLADGATLGQTFAVAGPGVAGIDLLTVTYAEQPDPQGTLTVTLRSEDGGQALATATTTGEDVEDNAWVAVTFDEPVEITGPAAFEVAWDGARPIGLRANVPPEDPEPEALRNDPYPYGELLRDGARAGGDLSFRIRGTAGARALPGTVRGLVAGAVGGLAGQPLFALFWAALLLASLALAVYGLRGSDRRREGSATDAAAELDEGGVDEQRGAHRERGADQPQ